MKRYVEFENNYIESLKSFIHNDKQQIDFVISSFANYFEEDKEQGIYFIEDRDFINNIFKVNKYRIMLTESYFDNKFLDLAGFNIKNYGPIKDTGLIKIPKDTHWIFLVGENGTGKTSILKAIASGICHRTLEDADPKNETIINIHLFNNDNSITEYKRVNNSRDINKRKPITDGFCSYGASRLKTSSGYKSKFSFTKSLSKKGLTDSLFDIDTVLIDIQDQINYWNRNPNFASLIKERKYFIKETITSVLPNIYDIRFSNEGTWEKTLYIERDSEGAELPPVTFELLASGAKSIISMIGDMMMRLFNQQMNIVDPSELNGLVIIDEIDIHLHPKLQKAFVEQLTKTFPNVQFIATTHSPIPLLGAPKNSRFFRIERNSTNGVELTDLTSLGIQNLLPNAILSSELFNMNTLFTRPNTNPDDIKTEDSITDIVKNKLIQNRLKQIATKLKNGI